MNDSPPRTRSRTGWLAVGVALTGAVIVLGGAYAWALLARQTVSEQQTYRQPVDRVDIDLRSADVTVTVGGSGQVVVDRELTRSFSAPVVDETWNGRTLRIGSGCPPGFRFPGCSVRYRVQVPREVAVDAEVWSGALSIRDVAGELRLNTTSGDVQVANTTGGFWARASSGSISASGLRSTDADVETTSGDADLRFAAPPRSVRAKVSSGNLGVAVPPQDAYSVQVSTSSGERRVDVQQDQAAPRTINAEATSGDVTIGYGGS